MAQSSSASIPRLAAALWLLTGLAAPAFSQETLQAPGWDDPVFSDYVARHGARIGEAADSPGVDFTLPVLGLLSVETGNAAAAPDDAAPQLPLSMTMPGWPECAAAEPEIVTIPETMDQLAGAPEGSWYVRSFDFGCLGLILEGDRTVPDARVTNAAPMPEESGTLRISRFIEDGGAIDPALAGQPTIALSLGGLVYSLTVECRSEEAWPFCADDDALRSLVRELVVVDGSPG